MCVNCYVCLASVNISLINIDADLCQEEKLKLKMIDVWFVKMSYECEDEADAVMIPFESWYILIKQKSIKIRKLEWH